MRHQRLRGVKCIGMTLACGMEKLQISCIFTSGGAGPLKHVKIGEMNWLRLRKLVPEKLEISFAELRFYCKLCRSYTHREMFT